MSIVMCYWIAVDSNTVMDDDKEGGCDLTSFLEEEDKRGSTVLIDFATKRVVVV